MKKVGNRLLKTLMAVIFVMVSVSLAGADFIEVPVPDQDLILNKTGMNTVLSMDGYGSMAVAGQPRLPARIVAVAIPPGAIVEDVYLTSHETRTLSGHHTIQPVGLKMPIRDLTEEEVAEYQRQADTWTEAIYSNDAFWPETSGEFLQTAGFRRYNLVDVRITPVQFNPISGKMRQHRDLRIVVEYQLPENIELINDYSPRMEARARQIIMNYDQAQQWYPTVKNGSRDGHDLVIITTAALESRVQSLVAFETNVKDRSVAVVTVESINASTPGNDLAHKIRNFLRERYPTSSWGIEDVLMVGHHSQVPMRLVDQSVGYGSPLTDFYFAELSDPDTTSWDSNGDGNYWDNGDSADFYSEVNIGRIPWSDEELVEAICNKSIEYEMNQDPDFKNTILLLGSYFWEDTDTAELMEAIMDLPHMADWNSVRMYEQNSTVHSTFPCDYELTRSNVQSIWPDGKFGFANLAGHGSYQSVHIMGYNSAPFWSSGDCLELGDDYPSIVISDACSTSDTDYTNLGQKMLKQGAVGYVGATKVALGSQGWESPDDGSSQTFDYFFTEGVTSKLQSQGEAHQYALLQTYQMNAWYYNKYEIAEWNLWGNPTLGMGLAIGSKGSISLDKEKYSVNGTIHFTLRDIDLNTTSSTDTATITVTTSGADEEQVVLMESDAGGVFHGSIQMAESNSVMGNNRLDVLHGQTVTARYIDADDGLGSTNVENTVDVRIDGQAAEVYNVGFPRVTSTYVEVTWETSEQTICTVNYGENQLENSVESSIPTTQHSVVLTDLDPCTFYYFIIIAEDMAGNVLTDDNNGIYYRTNTAQAQVAYSENLSTDPGWTTEGEWAFGAPTGQAAEHGNPDPSAGHTGANVYGYNLQGDYENNSPAYHLTTTPFDCSNLENVTLSYWRWLGVERNMYDNASIEISVDGQHFIEIWENPDVEFTDEVWTLHELDIAEYADGQSSVTVRWVMGATDQGWAYCGWNIDDVKLTSTTPCYAPTPQPRATATPEPASVPATGVHLIMSDTMVKEGDQFTLTYRLRNGMPTAMTVDMYIALEVYGAYWFYPTWVSMEEGVDFVDDVTVPAASEVHGDVLSFVWPKVEGQLTGLFFHSLLLDSTSGSMTGDYCWICWGYQ